MKGSRIGPVAVEDVIGQGGMGTVYRATVVAPLAGCELGDVVAVKIVHRHLQDHDGFVERFRREAHVGLQLRHPNVVPTLHAGVQSLPEGAVHYLVMNLVEGRTLREVADELGSLPEPLLIEVASQLGAGLAAIHAEGMVHRDLKPENVILTPDHHVRIMDLGVIRVLEETVELTRDGQFAGSLLYAAPEQIEGKGVGPAADLYSLGVVLYEMASAHHPFRRETSAAVIRAQLDDVPARLDGEDGHTSPFSAEVVATLLAKQPGDRFASADELVRVLAHGEASAWWQARAPSVGTAAARRPHVPVRRETTLYGRDEALATLRRAWEDARHGRGSVAVCLGEAGIGKTRLVDAFLGEIAAEDVHVLYGSYPPSGGIGGLSDAVLDHLGVTDLEATLEPLVGLGAPFAATLGAILRQAAAPSSSPDAIQTGMVALARGLARDKPVCWVVDDLHFAPASSRQVFLAMARALTEARVLLIGTARASVPVEELAWLARLDRFHRLELARLSPREVIQLLQDAFQSVELAERLGGKIAYRSDGVPFFVFEMIRGLQEGEFITRLPDGSYVESKVIDAIQVPSAIRDLIEARLASLPVDERAMLDVGAVQGFEFDAELIAHVLGLSRLEALQALASLARRRGVIRPSGRRYTFDHHQIQEVLVAELPPVLREEYHAMLAEALEARLADGSRPASAEPERIVDVAHHHLSGSHPARGLPYVEDALEHLSRTYRNEDYLALVEKADAVPGVDPAQRCRWALGCAHRFGLLGRADARESALTAALAHALEADDPGLEGRTRNQWVELLRHRGRLDEAQVHLERSLALGAATRDPKLRLGALLHAGSLAADRGRFAEARTHLETMDRLALEVGDAMAHARAVSQLGGVLFAQGQVNEARVAMQSMLDAAREADDVEGEVKARGNLGLLEVHAGHIDRAREHLEASLRDARRIGDRTGEFYAYVNLGNLHDATGNTPESRICHERALALARETGELVGEAIEEGNLGTVAFREGRLGAMLDRYLRTLDLAIDAQDVALEVTARGNLGQAWLAIGAVSKAREALDETVRRSQELGIPYAELYALTFLARVEREEGNVPLERRNLAAAWRLARGEAQPRDLVEVLTRMAHHHLDEGRRGRAVRLLRRARSISAASEGVRQDVLALCQLVVLEGGDAEEACRRFEEDYARLGATSRMEAAFLLWQATGESEYLMRAREDLAMLERGVPAEHREVFGKSRRLYRAIREAAGPSE